MPENQLKWRVPDVWTVIQANGEHVRIEVSQDGNTLTGTVHGNPGNPAAELTGIMSGSVEGDTINLTIYWPDETIAEFHGAVSTNGRVEGTTTTQDDTASSAEWYAEPALLAWK